MGEPILEAAKIPVKIRGVADTARVVNAEIDPSILTAANTPRDWARSCGLDPHMTAVSMGNPHITLYVEDVSRVPLEQVGPLLERHAWFPRRINVHFVQVHSPAEVTMRTWERGSGITLACGTGASAVCVAGVLTGKSSRKILAHLPGGDLTLEWKESDNHVYMTGPATEVFTGEIDIRSL
jgi:diaminopimelate epimerase